MPKFKLKPHYIEAADGIVESIQEEDTPPPTPEPSPEPPSEAEVKRARRKKQLSEKQLEALAKGRARVAENREKKKQLDKKNDSKFVEEGIKMKVAAKKKQSEQKKKATLSKAEEHRQKLLDTRNETKRKKKAMNDWKSMSEVALLQCQDVEEYDELSGHLETITEDDVFDTDKLKTKLNKIYDLYKYVPKTKEEREDRNSSDEDE